TLCASAQDRMAAAVSAAGAGLGAYPGVPPATGPEPLSRGNPLPAPPGAAALALQQLRQAVAARQPAVAGAQPQPGRPLPPGWRTVNPALQERPPHVSTVG